VNVEAWLGPLDFDESDPDDEPDEPNLADGEQDPPFVERMAPLDLDALDEPGVGHEELAAFLEAHLIDMDEDEWVDLCKSFSLYYQALYLFNSDSRVLSKRDSKTLQLLATRLRTHFSRATWDDLRLGVCAEQEIPSEFIAWRRLRILSELETRLYDCCVNSCCAFLGKYIGLNLCLLSNQFCSFLRSIRCSRQLSILQREPA
jgi:hypothetical protein